MSLIEVKGLKTYFHTESGVVRSVDGVNFSIEPQKTLGVVGESGCGKSVTALSIMGLIPSPPGRIEAGEIIYQRNGQRLDLAKLDPKGSTMRSIRGNEIAMIFQDPMTSLNPVYTIGFQIMEVLMLHQGLKKRPARQKAIDILQSVGIPSPEQRIDNFPHQLSGGMRQRAMIAMALACNPKLLIADEPTTGLDVTIQAQVLDLMADLRKNFQASMMFITHDLGVVAHIADDVMVMYLGKIVESAGVREIFHNPRHPYTLGLMESIPLLTRKEKERLRPIKGVVPDPRDMPPGCGFEPRCPRAMPVCRTRSPESVALTAGHKVACWLLAPESDGGAL